MKPIDISHLERYVFGDRALLDEILTIFIEQATMLSERLDPTADGEDWKSVVHTLKGASRGVGAFALGDIAERAEMLTDPGKLNERTEIVGEIRDAAAEAIAFAIAFRDQKE